MENKLKIRIIARSGIVWEGIGDSCSMVNKIGPFDILMEHTQFVTPIKDSVVVRDNNNIVYELKLDASALCRVKDNTIEIWLGI